MSTSVTLSKDACENRTNRDSVGSLGIVIVNWNSGNYLRACLASLLYCDALDQVAQIVVIDNNSHDDSWRDLPELPCPFRLLRNSSNRGFAAACNQGATLCRSEYVLFLNPDTILQPDSLSEPLEFMDAPRNTDVGICGIQLIDRRGQIGRTCSRLPTMTSLLALALRLYTVLPSLFPPHFMKEWDHAETREVQQVIGAFFFVRQELFTQLGGFDERFFMYYEEVDFCEQARRLGRRIMYLSSARAQHAGGGCSHQIRGRSLFYTLKCRIQYARKHLTPAQAHSIAFATLLLEPAIRGTTMVLSLRLKNLRHLLHAFSLLWCDWILAAISQRERSELSTLTMHVNAWR